MLRVSRGVYDTVWTLATAQGMSMRVAAEVLISGSVTRMRLHVLDVLDPGWRRRQPVPVEQESRLLERARSTGAAGAR